MADRAVILIDHGSRRKEANAMLAEVARLMRAELGEDIFISFAHMELAEPTLEQAVKECIEVGATRIQVHPYMLSPGRHATEDIPRMVSEIQKRYADIDFEVTEALGVHRGLIQAVKERCGL